MMKNPICDHKDAQSLIADLDAGTLICSACDEAEARAAYHPKVLRRDHIQLRIGETTLVGIFGRDYPLDGGNCCGIQICENDPFGLPCVNMTTENIEQALRRWPELEDGVDVEILDLHGREVIRVIDKRLPAKWKRKCCRTCGHYEDEKQLTGSWTALDLHFSD